MTYQLPERRPAHAALSQGFSVRSKQSSALKIQFLISCCPLFIHTPKYLLVRFCFACDLMNCLFVFGVPLHEETLKVLPKRWRSHQPPRKDQKAARSRKTGDVSAEPSKKWARGCCQPVCGGARTQGLSFVFGADARERGRSPSARSPSNSRSSPGCL